jgi:5-methyltetrahydropteroyltriglutamate--homocysteine methyltransferase
MNSLTGTTVLGYPRIGGRRELKRATEAYWAGRISAAELIDTAAWLRREVWTTLNEAGLGSVPSNTFSFYDQVLDTAVLFGAVPPRFTRFVGRPGDADAELATYFAMARGAEGVAPLELTKWFDTNYHYLVPELGPSTEFRLAGEKPVQEYLEASALGIETRPVVLGPLSLLLLAKPAPDAPDGFRPLDLLDGLLDAYAELLERLAHAGVAWVQLDEPVLAADRTPAELDALARAYARLGSVSLRARPRLLVATYFGPIDEALPHLAASPVEALGLDFVTAPGNLEALAGIGGLRGKTLVAGVVDGRNVWRTDLPVALATCASLLGLAGEVVVSSSCSLQHVPLDLDAEPGLDPDLRDRLAFARQKVDEVVLLGRAFTEEPDEIATRRGVTRLGAARGGTSGEDRRAAAAPVNPRVRARLDALGAGTARRPYAERAVRQRALGLPPLPTTTIGSFPQTARVRTARADLRAGRLDAAGYERLMRAEVDQVIDLQEKLGLDVLVHGEPERNDMVQYFAEQLDGYAATEHGWVQSYGTRYVRPPVLHGDVSRPEPMTVRWATYAQARTARPVKGMLTGPVTMLAWSFVRDDQPLAESARQVALALRDEIRDLEAAGIRIVQVDEPALRELLPLRRADRSAYLAWATAAFRLATSGVAETTQIHTHMCYSEFGEIIGAIDDLDADVTSVEAARSRMELLDDLAEAGYERGIGPGVYDIHSPRVPSVGEIEQALSLAVRAVPPERLWVNPDCGLKTRDYAEVEPALANLVEAARRVRAALPDPGL